MLIEIRTDSNIEGGEKLTDHLKGVVQSFGPNGTSKIRSNNAPAADRSSCQDVAATPMLCRPDHKTGAAQKFVAE